MQVTEAMKAPKVLEKDVVAAVRRYLELRGWRPVRMQVMGAQNLSTGRYVPAGEPGMPDHQFLNYLGGGKAFVLWIEFKSPNDKRRCTCRPFDKKLCGKCRQQQWRKREEERGALVWQISDLREFEQDYDRHFGWLHTGDGPKAGQTFMQFVTEKDGD